DAAWQPGGEQPVGVGHVKPDERQHDCLAGPKWTAPDPAFEAEEQRRHFYLPPVGGPVAAAAEPASPGRVGRGLSVYRPVPGGVVSGGGPAGADLSGGPFGAGFGHPPDVLVLAGSLTEGVVPPVVRFWPR